jgi:hypothetical protein
MLKSATRIAIGSKRTPFGRSPDSRDFNQFNRNHEHSHEGARLRGEPLAAPE